LSKEKILVALDVDSKKKAIDIVGRLRGEVGAFKVGLELVNSAGLGVLDAIREAGADRVFYDCKFHDIPNTVAGASRAAARMGVWMFNVHCSGGAAMMRAAKEAACEESAKMGVACPLVIGVTLLTSIDQQVLNDEMNVAGTCAEQVVRLARLAKESGLDGVVCSPHEIELVRAECGPEFVIVTPGVRPVGADIGDQKRVMTPFEAVAKGAGYLVIGRPITGAPDPAEAARLIASGV